MKRLVLLTAALLLLAPGCTSDKEPAREVYTVRGQLMGSASGGRAIVVDHERIPGYMDAMMMTLDVRDRDDLAGLQQGDKISFRLTIGGATAEVDQIERLPDSTRLTLSEGARPDSSAQATPDTVRVPVGNE